MIDHSSNLFSLTNPTRRADDDPYRPDEREFLTWAEGIKTRYTSFTKPGEHKTGAWSRKNLRAFTHHGDGDQDFGWLVKEDSDSDIPTPPLWEKPTSPPATTQPASETSPAHNPPTSRAQMIARYRQEMMELFNDVPESDYEISLKDIAELPRMESSPAERAPLKGAARSKQQKAPKRRMSRSESMDAGGFLLKMFLPFSIGERGRRSTRGGGGTGSRVSPKPVLADVEKGGAERNGFGDRSSSSGSSNAGNGIMGIAIGSVSCCCFCFSSYKYERGRLYRRTEGKSRLMKDDERPRSHEDGH